jgi:hypothetical protein
MLGVFKTFLADRDKTLCCPPKTSFITTAAASRAVPATELLLPEALENLLHAFKEEVRDIGEIVEDKTCG